MTDLKKPGSDEWFQEVLGIKEGDETERQDISALFGGAPFQLAYTVDEACRQLGIKRTTLYLAISNRYLTAKKIGAKTVNTGESLVRWLASLPRAEIKMKARKEKTAVPALPKPSTKGEKAARRSKRGRRA